MTTINALLISTIAGLSTLLGCIVIFFHVEEKKINKFISICLSFSIAIMIGLSITDLFPSSFYQIMLNYPFATGFPIVIFSFAFGVIAVYYINRLMENKQNNSLYKLGILSMLALMLHNFPEGIATFMGSVKDVELGLKLSIAIMLHNIPEGISIAVPIYYATGSKKKAIYNTLLSGLAEPLGALLAFLFLKNYITDLMISIVLLFVSGIMITLAIHEMLPKALAYKEHKYLYLGLILGIILILINHFFF